MLAYDVTHVKFMVLQLRVYERVLFLDIDVLVAADAAHLFRHAERLVGYATCASPFNAGAWVLSPKRDSYGALDDLLTRNFNACYGATPRGHGTLGRLQVTRAWERRGTTAAGRWASGRATSAASARPRRPSAGTAASCSCGARPTTCGARRTARCRSQTSGSSTTRMCPPWAQTDADPLDLAGVAGATFNRSLPCWFLWWGEFDRSPLAAAPGGGSAAPRLECAARLRRRRAALDGALAAARRAACSATRVAPAASATARRRRQGQLRDGHHVPYSCTLLASANSSQR